MHRFFIPPDCINGDAVIFPGDAARQLARVLRARPGDQVVALDNSGWEYLVTLEAVGRDTAQGIVASRTESAGEPALHVTLYQGVLKADKFEYVLQKGTELGVSRFVPVVCQRSIPRERASRHDRWRRIIIEAAEQSHRGRLPVLDEPLDFSAACDGVDGFALIPWEEESGTGLKSALRSWREQDGAPSSIGVFIGPEGGFTEEEVNCARERGIVPVSLGRRILRAETAGVAAVAAVMYEMGELGN
jgi:16S rRNA (uracil1498-N3)-methyltransferase